VGTCDIVIGTHYDLFMLGIFYSTSTTSRYLCTHDGCSLQINGGDGACVAPSTCSYQGDKSKDARCQGGCKRHDSLYNFTSSAMPIFFFAHNGMQMVWKTQSPGHVNCFGSDRPTTFHGSEEWSEEDKYNWYLFPAFDKLSIEQSQLLNIRILDMSPLYSRIDAHAMRDCLHFCVPGPLDLFSVLLLNMLISADI